MGIVSKAVTGSSSPIFGTLVVDLVQATWLVPRSFGVSSDLFFIPALDGKLIGIQLVLAES